MLKVLSSWYWDGVLNKIAGSSGIGGNYLTPARFAHFPLSTHGEGRENRRFGRGEVSYKSTQRSDSTKKARISKIAAIMGAVYRTIGGDTSCAL
jgi:hypothetical protein